MYKYNKANLHSGLSILVEVKRAKKIRHVQSALNPQSKTDFKRDYAKPI